MPYPSLADYTQAVRDYPDYSILDAKLKGGTVKRGLGNHILSYSGGFSIVFPLKLKSKVFALRCWTQDIADVETRYQEISDYLKTKGLPYFVEFAYVPEGILVNGTKWPITRMEWAEGETLCQFIEINLHDAALLRTAAAEFLKVVETLHTHQISHGDLQDGNILLKRSGTDVEIKLIDYDSVFVPALRGFLDSIVGLPQYQHPSRTAGGGVGSEKVDYFSELVIYLSLLAVAEKPTLWNQFKGGTDGALLFVAADFRNPAQSSIFQELENLSPDVKLLASKLKDFCARTSIDQLEPLEMLLPRIDPIAKKACNRGLIFLHSKRFNEAIAEFEKAIRIESSYKEAHHGLALVYLQSGSFDSAKTKAKDTLRIDSNYQPALQLLDTVKQILRNLPPKPPSSQPGSGPTSRSSSLKNPTIQDLIGAVITFFQRRQHYFNRRTLIYASAVCLFAIVLHMWSPWSPNQPVIDDTSPEIIDANGPQEHADRNSGGEARQGHNRGRAQREDVSTAPVGGVPPQTTRSGRKPVGPIPTQLPTAVVSVNAIPWAEVSIKLPDATSFIMPQSHHFAIPPNPNEKISNITPIRGRLKVPTGTEIKLMYGDREFVYIAQKNSETISHNFLKP